MGLKQNFKSGLAAFCRTPLVSSLARRPQVERVLDRTPFGPLLYGNGWGKVHPFDRQYGTETSGFVTSDELIKGTGIKEESHPYAGSQPSILREVLATLPGLEAMTFVDLGCGKGRPLFVASEFPFKDIVGVELSPQMAAIARKNAATIATRYPSRTKVRIELGDAIQFQLPPGDFAIFLYNPFAGALIDKLIAAVEAAVEAAPRQVYVLYYAPVFGGLFDASPVFTRRLARTFPYAKEEVGYGPDAHDAMVVWQAGTAPAPTEPAAARIVVTIPNVRAELVH